MRQMLDLAASVTESQQVFPAPGELELLNVKSDGKSLRIVMREAP